MWLPLYLQSFGIRLKDAVVIVDEAHNLIDAVNSVHSSSLGEGDLAAAHAQLSGYQERFRARLGPGNLCNLDTLLSVAGRLRDALRGPTGDCCPPQSLIEPFLSCQRRVEAARSGKVSRTKAPCLLW